MLLEALVSVMRLQYHIKDCLLLKQLQVHECVPLGWPPKQWTDRDDERALAYLIDMDPV